VCHGWRIFVWSEFRSTWTALRNEVDRLSKVDPQGYRAHPTTIFLRDVRDIVLTEVPADPSHERYQQGNTLGKKYRHWRRAKFRSRFRLFFRYSSSQKIIIYVWLNNENSLRKEGGKTDVYTVFRAMLERKRPPTDWNDLLAECEEWRAGEVEE
jgi:toxin YhaV